METAVEKPFHQMIIAEIESCKTKDSFRSTTDHILNADISEHHQLILDAYEEKAGDLDFQSSLVKNKLMQAITGIPPEPAISTLW